MTISCFAEFLAFRRDNPRAMVLMRCGDFYECVGFDALMLVEHCGNNPMAPQKGVVKAGCPWRNLRRTLEQLTHAGLSVVRGGGWRGRGGSRRCWVSGPREGA